MGKLSSPRKLQLARQKKGLCPLCGKEKPMKKNFCASCAKNNTVASQKKKRKHIEAGKCSDCGKSPLASRTRCAECLVKESAGVNTLRAQRKHQGLCYDCGLQANGYSRCSDCRAKQRKN